MDGLAEYILNCLFIGMYALLIVWTSGKARKTWWMLWRVWKYPDEFSAGPWGMIGFSLAGLLGITICALAIGLYIGGIMLSIADILEAVP